MKYAKKPPSTDKELSEKLQSDGWKKIKEPSNLVMAVLCSIPFMVLLGGLTLFILGFLNPSLFDFLRGNSISITINLYTVLFIIFIFIWMMLHEFLHAVFIPNFIKSENTFWGINGLFAFVFTTERIQKGRFIVISVMPYLLLSVILPFVLHLFGLLNTYTALLCFLNAVGSCVDFLTACLIAFQVPGGQTIVSNGFETYYNRV